MEQNPQPTLIQQQRKFKFIFHKKTYWKCARPFNLAEINKCKPKMLSSLDIANIRLQNIGPKGFKDLCRALAAAKIIHNILLEGENLSSQQYAQIINLLKNSKHLKIMNSHRPQKLNQKSIECLSKLAAYKHFIELPIMMYFTQEIKRKAACRIFRQMKGLKKLKTLSLDLPICNGIEMLEYRPPRSLKNLHILFRKKADEQSLKTFATNVQKCCQLKRLALLFPADYEINHSIWPFPLQTLKYLQELILNISFNIDQKSQEVQTLLNNFTHLKHLTALDFEFAHTQPANQSHQLIDSFFITLFDNIHSLNQLEKLRLKLNHFIDMTSKHLQQFTFALRHLKNLKHLTLKLPFIKSSKEALLSFFQTLQNLTDLHVLHLTFLDTNLSCSDLEALFNSIPNSHLTSLKLALGHPPTKSTNILTTGIEKIVSLWKHKEIHHPFSGISRFTNLSTLRLELMSFYLSVQDFKQLSLNLSGLHQLSYLTLTLPQFDSANNFEGLQSLTSCLKEIKNLTKLDLSFEGRNVQDREIDIFGAGLIGCKKLKTLRLTIRKADKLTEKCLDYLLKKIKGLEKTLDDLLLEFCERKSFGERTFLEFLQGLIVLKKLKYFKFIDDSGLRGQQTLLNFPENLKDYENLKCLKKFIINRSRFI